MSEFKRHENTALLHQSCSSQESKVVNGTLQKQSNPTPRLKVKIGEIKQDVFDNNEQYSNSPDVERNPMKSSFNNVNQETIDKIFENNLNSQEVKSQDTTTLKVQIDTIINTQKMKNDNQCELSITDNNNQIN